ncbi:MAG TPA: FKBP-type peptidyl-prolyl cis-trans isomerase [Bacteroidales bacterium]
MKEKMKIGPQKTAKVIYTLTNAKNGNVIEKMSEENPAYFLFGTNQLLPRFEESMAGLEAGDGFDFVISAEDAYGEVDPYAIFDIPLEVFEVDGKIDEQMMQAGNVIPMTDDEGNKHHGEIVKIMKDAVTMDFNHPLAGKSLRFAGKILEVSDKNSN